MKRKEPEAEPVAPVPPEVFAGDEAPPERVAGRPNPEYYRWLFRVNARLAIDVAQGKKEFPKGYNVSAVQSFIADGARMAGLDPKHLADARSEAEKMQDAAEQFLKAPESLLEWSDSQIEAMEKAMDTADHLAKEHLAVQGSVTGTLAIADKKEAQELEEWEREKKAWRSRLARLRRLRERARSPIPAGSNKAHAHALRAARPLRLMIYVFRYKGDLVPLIGIHHVRMACSIYLSRNGMEVTDHGVKDNYPWQGCLLTCPPGHNKTTLGAYVVIAELCNNPKFRWLFGHAQAGMAEDNLRFVARHFDAGEVNGRRIRSLFPDTPPVETVNKNTFRFKLKSAQKQATIRAFGIKARISGGDADGIWFDDPCDQEIAEQETERNRVFDRMNGTWRTRLRGKKTWELTTTTLWHHDDPNCRRINMVRDKKLWLYVCIQSCGGPNTMPPFGALWPDEYPPAKLRQIYVGMRNPRLYAATYMSDPRPDEMRMIKRLALYDQAAPEHRAFLESVATVFHLSIDPSATNTEKSDHAAFIYAGFGDVVGTDTRDGRPVQVRRPVLRIVDAMQIKASQVEAAPEVIAYARSRSVHYVHVEVRSSNGSALAEILENHDIDVQRYDPLNRKKDQRLKDVSVMLDDSLRDRGLPGAVVEFPGVLDNGRLVIDPQYQWLAEQILEFGAINDDHACDAVVQLCKHLGPDLGVGLTGAVTAAAQSVAEPANPRLARMFEEAERAHRKVDEPNADWEWGLENL